MRSEIAIPSLLLDYINETSHTNNPGPSHFGAVRAGYGNSIVDQVVFFNE